MLKQKITSLMLALLIITSMACNTECDHATQYPLQNLNYYVAYTGYDTLRFLHNNTDTQVFIGQGINYFWVRKPAYDDTQCPEDHQSVSIQFRNQQNGNTLKMEYIYDYIDFANTSSYNSNVDFKFYFNTVKCGIEQPSLKSPTTIIIGGMPYTYVTYFSNSIDTLSYIVYKVPSRYHLMGGVLKLKLDSNDSYEIIK